MPDREPEPWESGAASPFLWIETPQGTVEMWALGEDRFRITAPNGHEQLVTGYYEAERTADALAGRPGLGAGKQGDRRPPASAPPQSPELSLRWGVTPLGAS
jgi:hypothetical protein